MPIETHPNLPSPKPKTLKLWRYMDFPKFVSLVSRSQLYLVNLEVLASNDPHEGLLSQPNYRHREWSSEGDLTPEERAELFSESMDAEKRRIQFESHQNSREYWARRRHFDRRTLFVNCWHENETESAAMWAQYAPGGSGIAIVSSYEQLERAVLEAEPRLFLGKVEYLDWGKQPVNNQLLFPLSKRKSFEHEKEWRLIYWDLETQEPINAYCARLSEHTFDHLYRRIAGPINWNIIDKDIESVPYRRGIYVPIALDQLILSIHVAPSSADWFIEAVSSVCTSFGLQIEPRQSEIGSPALR